MRTRHTRQFAIGAASGLGSAVLFGLSAPLAKLLLPNAAPWLLAGLLYLGAGIGLSVIRLIARAQPGGDASDRLRRQDRPRLFAIVVAGFTDRGCLFRSGASPIPRARVEPRPLQSG